MERVRDQSLLLTLGCAAVHLGGLYVLFAFFLSQTPDADYLGFLTAYVQKARSLFYQAFGFRALALVGIAVSGALTVRGLMQVFEDDERTARVLRWVGPALFAYMALLLWAMWCGPTTLILAKAM